MERRCPHCNKGACREMPYKSFVLRTCDNAECGRSFIALTDKAWRRGPDWCTVLGGGYDPERRIDQGTPKRCTGTPAL